MCETLTREQIDVAERTLRALRRQVTSEGWAYIEGLCAMSRALLDERENRPAEIPWSALCKRAERDLATARAALSTERTLRLRQMGEASVTAAALSAAEHDLATARRELAELRSKSAPAPVCSRCHRPIEWEPTDGPFATITAIRCADCRQVMCPGCAYKHFSLKLQDEERQDMRLRRACEQQRELDAARRELGEVRKVLGAISYCVTDEDTSLRVCPCCSGIAPWQNPIVGDGDTIGHTNDCAVAAALKGSDHV